MPIKLLVGHHATFDRLPSRATGSRKFRRILQNGLPRVSFPRAFKSIRSLHVLDQCPRRQGYGNALALHQSCGQALGRRGPRPRQNFILFLLLLLSGIMRNSGKKPTFQDHTYFTALSSARPNPLVARAQRGHFFELVIALSASRLVRTFTCVHRRHSSLTRSGRRLFAYSRPRGQGSVPRLRVAGKQPVRRDSHPQSGQVNFSWRRAGKLNTASLK